MSMECRVFMATPLSGEPADEIVTSPELAVQTRNNPV
jgi:hypothetical protein